MKVLIKKTHWFKKIYPVIIFYSSLLMIFSSGFWMAAFFFMGGISMYILFGSLILSVIYTQGFSRLLLSVTYGLLSWFSYYFFLRSEFSFPIVEMNFNGTHLAIFAFCMASLESIFFPSKSDIADVTGSKYDPEKYDPEEPLEIEL